MGDGTDDFGFYVICGLGLVALAAGWLVAVRNRRNYRPQPDAEALRADPDASGRMSANEGRLWLTVSPRALVLQPQGLSVTKQVDHVVHRHDVLCVDVDSAEGDEVRLNVYGRDGVIRHQLQIDALPQEDVHPAAEMLRSWGWPVGEHLWSRPRPPMGDEPPAEVVRWVPYWESPYAHWD